MTPKNLLYLHVMHPIFGIGYTLSQLDNNKKECLVAYGGKSLTNEERK